MITTKKEEHVWMAGIKKTMGMWKKRGVIMIICNMQCKNPRPKKKQNK